MESERQGHNNNMIVGDFNFIDQERQVKGLNSKEKLVSTIWKPFLEKWDMVDPFRQQNPKQVIWSFVGKGKSKIDRVYVNS